MITRMTRYDFILLSANADEFVNELQRTGIVDITRSVKAVDDWSSKTMVEAESARKAMAKLKSIDYPVPEMETELDFSNANTIFSRLDSLESEYENLLSEAEDAAVWGHIDTGALEELKKKGFSLHFYSIPSKRFDPSWENDYATQIIDDNGKRTLLVIVASDDGRFPFPEGECAAPEGDASHLRAEAEEIRDEMEKEQGRLMYLKSRTGDLEESYLQMLTELDNHLARKTASTSSEGLVTIFTGFAPTEMDAMLKEKFSSMDVYFLSAEAGIEDNPPIKLKNNSFSRNFEVFTEMYGLPAYNEFDPTGFLSIFYLLFFAICMGDAGYGIVLMLAALVLRGMEGSLAKMHKLVFILGAGTFVIGLAMGTFFGVNLAEVSWLSPDIRKLFIQGKMAGYDVQMILALAIGILHICLAMTVKMIWTIKKNGIRNSLSSIGWTLLIVGTVVVGCIFLAGFISIEAAKWAVITIGAVSALGIYIFNKIGRNPLKNIGSGLWDTYNMASGLMGDVLSYIRLYALGLSGAMLGSTFNMLAGMVRGIDIPVVNWIGFIILILLGHVLNIALSALGAFVHPLRLNFVEFFKNSGYEGTGVKYNPLEIKTNK